MSRYVLLKDNEIIYLVGHLDLSQDDGPSVWADTVSAKVQSQHRSTRPQADHVKPRPTGLCRFWAGRVLTGQISAFAAGAGRACGGWRLRPSAIGPGSASTRARCPSNRTGIRPRSCRARTRAWPLGECHRTGQWVSGHAEGRANPAKAHQRPAAGRAAVR